MHFSRADLSVLGAVRLPEIEGKVSSQNVPKNWHDDLGSINEVVSYHQSKYEREPAVVGSVGYLPRTGVRTGDECK